MADPNPAAPKLPPMTRLLDENGGEVYVPESQKWDYMSRGFADPRIEAERTSGPEGGAGALDYALGTAEQGLAGMTMGLSSGAADVLAGGANVLANTAGYQGPRAAAPGIDAPLAPESNAFTEGMIAQQAARGERAEALGPVVSTGLQVAGGLATLGLGSAGAVGSTVAAPNLLVNQLGQRAATKVIGDAAVQAGVRAALTRAGGAAVGAGLEGAIGGAVSAGAESIPQIIENPEEAVKDMGVAAGYGAALGSAFGGALGLAGEAAKDLSARSAAKAAALDSRQALVPPARPVVDAVAAAPELEARANVLASQLPAEQRSLAQTFLKNANAISREGEVLPASVREATADMSAIRANEDKLAEIAGIRAKREFNREVFEGTEGGQLTDIIAPEDAAELGQKQLRRTTAQGELDSFTSQLEAAQTAANDAASAQKAARDALDAAGDPTFKPSKSARERMREMGLTGLGTDELPAAQSRVAARIAELEGQLAPPKPAEPPPMTVKNRATFPDGTKGVLYDVPGPSGSRGRASMDFPADSDLATVSTIELAKDAQGAGLGTRMYAQMFDDAAAEGRRFASDTQRAPQAQSWWESQVKKGNAVYDAELDRFILNKRPIPLATVPEAVAPSTPRRRTAAAADEFSTPEAASTNTDEPLGKHYRLSEQFVPTGKNVTDQDRQFIDLMRKSIAEAELTKRSRARTDTSQIFISDVLDGIPEAQREAVKAALPDMQQRGLLKLSRVDLVHTMDPAKVRESAVYRTNPQGKVAATFNFLDLDSLGAKVADGAPPTRPAAKAAVPSEKLAAELSDLHEARRFLGRPSQGRMAELRGALKEADSLAGSTTKDLERLRAGQKAAQDALAAADSDLAAHPAPRRMTKMESESRQMLSEVSTATKKFLSQVAGDDAKAAEQLLRQVQSHSEKAREFFRKGDYEAAYNQIDQGLRASIADFASSTKSNAAEEFAKGIYSAPQSLLERTDLFGAAAERQARINPSITKDMRNKSDPAFKALWAAGRGEPASGWGTATHARSDTVQGLLSGLGNAGSETAEAGVKHGLASTIESQAVRAADLGPEAQAIARDSAQRLQRIYDTMDNVALAKRDAETVRGLLQSGQTTAGVVAMAGALAGSPSLALPAVAGRWLIGAVARQKTALVSNLLKGSAKLISGGVKVTGPIARTAIPVGMNVTQREKNLKHYREMMDPMSPTVRQAAESAEVLNQQSPGLGDAALRHEVEVAQYVNQFAPKPPSPALFSPPPRNTDVANRRLDRVLAAVGAPAKTFQRILNAQASNEDLDAMRTLYPGPYQKMVDALLQAASANPGKVKDVSMQMYLSRVTGQPLTPSLMNLTRSQARAQAATAGVEDAGKPQGQGANGADGVTKRAPMRLDPNEVYGTRADRVLAGA